MVNRPTVAVFDTTLRDGEQAPGFSMSPADKVRLAGHLERLGVTVIEAGFPVASAADFDGVVAVSRAVRSVSVAALARAVPEDVHTAWNAVRAAVRSAHPRVPGHVGPAPVGQAADHPRGMPRTGGVGRPAGAVAVRRRRVLGRGCHAHRPRLPGRGRRRGGRGRRHHHQPARHRRLRAARRHPPDVHRRGRARRRSRRALGALPQRPGPGGGQLAGRRAGRRPAGRVHHQRHRRTRRQRRARRDRDGPRRPRRRVRLPHRRRHHRALPDQPGAERHRVGAGAAQQGDRRRQRLRARGRHPPGRHGEEPAHLRDHAARVGRRAADPPGARPPLGHARARRALPRARPSAAGRRPAPPVCEDVVSGRPRQGSGRRRARRADPRSRRARRVRARCLEPTDEDTTRHAAW